MGSVDLTALKTGVSKHRDRQGDGVFEGVTGVGKRVDSPVDYDDILFDDAVVAYDDGTCICDDCTTGMQDRL